ncbi:uncharacterized protein N7479_006468 [Penicillium vulpinum]|uniref:Tat pathway signal sequence n=1 Tax=Penicillium vulpinum TaxID=29845 RepID=A0A1V6S2X5_9EURO|nr:uncharacterized protein N7479_006468 [Penicillium vulpinum]KAJ5959318.1 hypothetical protein N7479_006468 [Penicillium vulpinum]OQE07983.1 hypothetical protein PENVUL_c011G10100 [Penicillium vulpinum]
MFEIEGPSYFKVEVEKTQNKDSLDEDSGSTDGLLYESRTVSLRERWVRKGKSTKIALALALCVLIGTHILAVLLGLKLQPNVDDLCLHHNSAYSPVLKEINPELHLVQFNGTLGHPSEFTGDPSPELDAVWDKWAYVKYASIPPKEFLKLPGADPEAARLTPEYGGGYIGFLEISHQLHCLNMMRQAMNQDYYNNPDFPEQQAPVFTDRPFTVKMHLQHCVEILRQNIMCNADVGIIPHEWVSQTPDPFANFNTWHKCRDLKSVENWIHEHEIPTTPDGSDLPIPLDSKIFTALP